MSQVSVVFLVDSNFGFLRGPSEDQKWILIESLKLSLLRIITGYLKDGKIVEWGWKFFNSHSVATHLDRRSLDVYTGLDRFSEELEINLNKSQPKKQANRSYLQRIDTTLRQVLADFQMDQLATDAKEAKKSRETSKTFEIWTITPLPTHTAELDQALLTESDLYEDEPLAKQMQQRVQKRLQKLLLDEGGLKSLLSKHGIKAHFIDSRHILPGKFVVNFGPGDEFDESEMVEDYKGLSLFKSSMAQLGGHVVPIEVMQYGSRLLPVLDALVHESDEHLWEGKFSRANSKGVLNETVRVMPLSDDLTDELRAQWAVKKVAKSTAKSTAKKSSAKQAEVTGASLVLKGLAKQTAVGADWVTREQLLCSFSGTSGEEDTLLPVTLEALHHRACLVVEVTGVDSPFMAVLRPVTLLLAIVQPVLDKFKAQVTKAANQKQTEPALDTDKTELKKRIDYFTKLATKHATAASDQSTKDKADKKDDVVDQILHGTNKMAKQTSQVHLAPQQHDSKTSKNYLKELSDNATNNQMVIEFPAFKDLKTFLTSNFTRFSTDPTVSHVERQLSACIRHAVASKSVKDVLKAVKTHLFKPLPDLIKEFTGDDIDVQNKVRNYLLQVVIRFELSTSLLSKPQTESSPDALVMTKETRKEIKSLLQAVAAIMDFTNRGSFATFMDDVISPLYAPNLPYTLIKLYNSFWLPLPMSLQELAPELAETESLVGTIKGVRAKNNKNQKKDKGNKKSAFSTIVTTTSDIAKSSSPVKSDDRASQMTPVKPKTAPPAVMPKTKQDIVAPPTASSADLVALNNSLQQFQRSSVLGRRYGTNLKQVTVTYRVTNTNLSDELDSENKKRKRDDTSDDNERENKRTKLNK